MTEVVSKPPVEMAPCPNGAYDLSCHFGLSYANYLTIPRSILEAMPDHWQGKLSVLLSELDERVAANKIEWPVGGEQIEVRLRTKEGRYTDDPYSQYRHRTDINLSNTNEVDAPLVMFLPKLIEKVWGTETEIANSFDYCCKILTVESNHQTSWHYHHYKDETFYVQKGVLFLYYSYDNCLDGSYKFDPFKALSVKIHEGQTFHIPPGLRHRLINLGNSNLQVLEVSTIHQDVDVVRLEAGA